MATKTEMTQEKQEALLAYLLRDRLANYGYDWRDFRRLRDQRHKARKAVNRFVAEHGVAALHWARAPLAYRIDWREPGYTTGQSQNEELTNLLRQLVNPSAKWLS